MTAQSYTTVVVTTDLSSRAALAVPHALRLLGGCGALHLVYVLDFPRPVNPLYAHYGPTAPSPAERARQHADATARLRALLAEAGVPAGVEAHAHAREHFGHDVVPPLCRIAQELGAEVLCVASHGRRGLARITLGSVARGLLACATLPVLVVPVPKGMLGTD